MDKMQFAFGRQALSILTAVLLFLAAGVLVAQDDTDGQDQDGAVVPTLDPRVAQDLLSAYELLEDEEYQQALQQLNRLMERRGDSMKDFDKASVLQIRGTAHVNLDDMDSALEDFSAALQLEALPEDQQNRLRFNLAQIYFVNEHYQESIQLFEEWMKADVKVTDSAYFMLGAAYYNLDEYQKTLESIQKAIEVAPEPQKRYYDLANSAHAELGNVAGRIRLLEKMVELWPDSLSYWRQLSSLYLDQGDQFKSFAALETAYVNGLIESGSDIIMLAQYYSTFDNPHRGARLIEKEMQAGRVERTVENLELLSQLWSQAREHSKAIPVLREAAQMSDDGLLSFRLGQALLANEQNEDAERALESALEKGGLDESRRAEAWMLLGNARFNQAEPGDRGQRDEAEQAFAQAERFSATRQQASDWRKYINAINQTERRQAALEEEQSAGLATAARQRLLTACRAQQLAGSELSEQCASLLAEGEEGGNGPGR
ncbi:MAG: tetratricopeptide repeat protein [Wenzhouxiangellaceae bacterium]